MQPTHRRTAVIGGAVGVATAGAIVFLVAKGHPDEEPAPRELPRPAPTAAPVPKTAPGNAELDPAAKPAPVPKDDAKAKTEAEAKKAEAERQAKLEKARALGILGSTALKQGGAFASLTKPGKVTSGFDDANIYGGLLGNEAGDMNGGFGYGRSGFGPGGGGTGWGTIGTGRYGVIGSGNGTGTGYGRGGSRGSAVPTVSIGQASVAPAVAGGDGNLDKAIIRRYVRRNIQKIQYCYEKELLAKSALKGTVATSFTITESGQVGSASATGVDTEVASCVANVIRGIEFPKPKGQGGVSVTYPFTFRPAGS